MTALLSLALAALLAAPAGVAAAPRSANRALERIFEKGPYSDSGAFQITKAFKVAVDAGVEERDALALVEACADGEFSPEQVARILSLAAQIALDDLPADLFVSKVHEGVAKGVDPDLVVRAAERRALDINRASKLLKMLALEGVSTSDREELVPDVAEALAAGVDEGRIRQILTEGAAAGDSVRDIRRKLFP
jgi:ABC-type amino acid transport substrate-binding protein